MKKIIISALIMGIMSNGAVNVYAMTGENNNGTVAVSATENATKTVGSFDELLTALQDKKIKVINLSDDITISEEDLGKLRLINGKKELLVDREVHINGNDKTIDLDKLATFTIKGKGIKLSNITIKDSSGIGIQVYNSRDIYLENVTVEGSERYGIFANGSEVKLKNCTTRNNKDGGIFVSRSVTLQAANCIDSVVEVIDNITFDESISKVNVSIKNLEHPQTGIVQDNEFKMPKHKVREICKKVTLEFKNRKLSDFYLDLLNIEDRETKVKEDVYTYEN